MLDSESVVGIDISKAFLDVAFGFRSNVRRFPNSSRGHRQLAAAVGRFAAKRIVMEASGGYERGVLVYLNDRNLPAVRVNPRQVRDFARASGILAKTDAIDAKLLVRFGAAVEPVHRPLPSPARQRLADLQARRAGLVASRAAEFNRLEQTTDRLITRTIKAMITAFDRQIALIEAESARVIAEHQELERLYAILTSVPGVGPVTAAVLMGGMPELGSLSRQEAAALAGLAPFNADSGQKKGARHIRGGRASVRTALYMATLSAARHNPVIAEDFQRLAAAGKPHKVLMAACMRKLLIILNALVRDDLLWGQKQSPAT